MKYFIIAGLLFTALTHFTQDIEGRKKNRLFVKIKSDIDTIIKKGKSYEEYVKKIDSKLEVSTFISDFDNHFVIADYNDQFRFVDYYPNNTLGLGLRVKYKRVALAYSVPLPQVNGSKGLTQTRNIKLAVMSNFYNMRIEGYYNQNMGVVTTYPIGVSSSTGKEFKLNKDITTLSAGLGMYFIISNKVSLAAAYNLGFVQLKSGGGWGIGLYGDFSQIRSKSLLIEEAQSLIFSYLDKQKRIDIYSTNILPSYSYTHVFKNKNFYYTTQIGLGLGIGGIVTETIYSLDPVFSIKPLLCGKGLLILGYRKNRLSVHSYGNISGEQVALNNKNFLLKNRIRVGLNLSFILFK